MNSPTWAVVKSLKIVADGKPMANVKISLFTSTGAEVTLPEDKDETDDDGILILDLTEGKYKVKIQTSEGEYEGEADIDEEGPAVVIVTMTLVLVPPVPTERPKELRFGLSIQGGLNSFSGDSGDYTVTGNTIGGFYNEWPGLVSGNTSSFMWNDFGRETTWQVSVYYKITPYFALGFGTSYLEISTGNNSYVLGNVTTYPYSWGTITYDQSFTTNRTYKFRLIPINVSLYLFWPRELGLFGLRIVPYVYTGLGYYFARMTHDKTEALRFVGTLMADQHPTEKLTETYDATYNEVANATAIAINLGGGVDLRLARGVWLGVLAYYRWLSIGDWEGTWKSNWNSVERFETNGHVEGETTDSGQMSETGSWWIWMYSIEGATTNNANMRIWEQKPNSDYMNVSKVNIKFNAFVLKISLTFRFNLF
jgi:hypothetical protein